jgi:SulP family sulfate permease
MQREDKKSIFRADVLAGMSTAVVMIPQAMAYALLAGLSPVHGLYAATIPVLFYGVFGGSPHISVAPVALLAIMHGVLLHHVPAEIYLEQSILLTGMVGVIMLALWVLRLGLLARLLSHSVIEGFIQAAALLTALSQVRYLLGISVPRGGTLWGMLAPLMDHIVEVDWTTVGISLVCSAILLLRYWRKGPPYALLCVFVGGCFVAFGVDTGSVGAITQIVPEVRIPSLEWDRIRSVAPAAILISLVAYVESIALAQHFAAKHRYRIFPSRELIALGGANLLSSFVGGIAVGAGFSRSAIHEGNGARTKMAGIVSGICVILVLLSASSLLAFVPYAALSSIVFLASLRLVQIRRVWVLWKSFRSDFVLFTVACLGVLFLGIEQGLGLAIITQVVLYPWRSAQIILEEKEDGLHVSGFLNYVEAHRLIAYLEDHDTETILCMNIEGIDAGAIVEIEKQSTIRWIGWPERLHAKLSPTLLQEKKTRS